MKMRVPDAMMVSLQESGGIPATAAVVAVFRGQAPTLEHLRDRVQNRLAPVTRLRLHLDTDDAGKLRPPYSWRTAEHLEAARHVVLDRLCGGQRLQEALADLIGRAMPDAPGDPLWQLRVVQDTSTQRFALVLRVHHALLDGTSAYTVLRLLSDERPGVTWPASEDLKAEPVTGAGLRTVAHAVTGLLRRTGRYPCNKPVDEGRNIVLQDIHADVMGAARNALPEGRTSPNDVFLAAFGAALHACPAPLGDAPRLDRVYAAVPVDVRGPRTPYAMGNYVSAVRVRVPLETADPYVRLREVRGQMQENKRLRRAEGLARLTDCAAGLGAIGTKVLAHRLFGGRSPATFACTFPRWGFDPLVLDGCMAESVFAVPNLSPRMGFIAALSQYAERLSLCLTSDDAHLPYLRPLADAFVSEMHALALRGSRRTTGPGSKPHETKH
ncbi:wax ester/triacylglycerol synthase domain-containing protein [Streptomyces canus]|uniref:wax ester/triacylglycerol synthase domain-containing protein n=1 Tax=Streptomyces canus TaxID=58343 RepID=UPI0032508327